MYQFSESRTPLECRARYHHIYRHICRYIGAIAITVILSSNGLANEALWQVVGGTKASYGTTVPGAADEGNRTGSRSLDVPVAASSNVVSSDGGWYRIAHRQGAITQRVQSTQHGHQSVDKEQPTNSSIPVRRRDTLLLSATGLRTTIDPPVSAEGLMTSGSSDRATPSAIAIPAIPSAALKINLDLFVGEVKVLADVDVKRVAVGNGGIINAEVIDSGELLIIAGSAGSSSLRLWHKNGAQTDYNIRVSESDPETRVHMQRMVRMRVRMVEFRKSALGKLGIDWSDSVNGPVIGASGLETSRASFQPSLPGFEGSSGSVTPFSTYFGVASNISSRINFLTQNGDAVTLAEPVLSAMNGGEANFLAGGEIPYPTIGEDGRTQVEFKEYGIKLDIAPLIDSTGLIRARVDTEISQLDSSVSVQGAPGLLTRRAQTEVTVRSGETIVISGLLSSETSTDVNAVPGLGKLPVIGRFFRSKNERNTVNELVIFVTPEVIEPSQPMINTRERRYFSESEKRVEMVRQQLPLME